MTVKSFKADDILKMSVNLIERDMAADLDKDGKISANDARIKLREESGLASPKVPSENTASSVLAEDIVDRIIGQSSSYSYDVNSDPLYKQYSELYKNEGLLSAKDVFGLASSLTGGYGNSYGLTAAGNVMDRANEKTALKAEELEEKAYDRHFDELERMYDILDMLYENEDRQTEKEDRQREIKKDALDFALSAADSGDYYYLEKLGIDIKGLQNKDISDRAQLLAKYGDYSGLSEIGIDITKLEKDELKEMATLFAKYGDYSLLKLLGADTSNRETEDLYNRLILKGKI